MALTTYLNLKTKSNGRITEETVNNIKLKSNVSSQVSRMLESIDLFRLYIMISQYRLCDNTQEVWSFLLFIKKSACRHIHACMRSFLMSKTKDQSS